ncbi:hypothetical protein WOLCODRAFT_32209, partial [Wolfiporia cocos MD-104 SS10]
MLMLHPVVLAAVNQIMAACRQLCASMQWPFLTVCNVARGYHLPTCLCLLEAAHIPEILREAGPRSLDVNEILRHMGQLLRAICGSTRHVLHILVTHHITCKVCPDVFTNNRISGAIDSGRTIMEFSQTPETKHDRTNGIAAFIGLCMDELFKSVAHLPDCYLPS